MILSGNTLYGTTEQRRHQWHGHGVQFYVGISRAAAIDPHHHCFRNQCHSDVAELNATGYTLQSTTNLVPPVVWSAVSGQNAVTNPISGTQKFYQLSQ